MDQNDIQILYDYVVHGLLFQHMLTGADKKSTYGLVFKKEAHVNLNSGNAYSQEPQKSPKSETSTKSSDRHMSSSFVSSNSSTSYNSVAGGIENIHLLDGNTKISPDEIEFVPTKYHMLIYKLEMSYIVLFINGKRQKCKKSVIFEKNTILAFFFLQKTYH